MFSNKDVIPVQDYRIDTYPSLKELSEYTQKALQVRGMKHVYIWEDKEVHKTFKLAMLAKQGIPEMEWWLHEDSVVGSRMIWFYKTKDMHLIFANMCEAVGAPASLHEEEIEAHRQAKKNFEKEKEKRSSLGDRLVKKKTRDITAGAYETSEELDPQSAGASGGPGPGSGLGLGTYSGAMVESEIPLPNANAGAAEDYAQTTMSRIMGGDLKIRPIGAILNTAAQADVTGHLTLSGPGGQAVVQFGLGRPVHAYSDSGKEGTDVLLELFTWREGFAEFQDEVQPESASIQESVEELVQQGEALLANYDFLERNNINEISILQQPPIKLSEDKMLERLQDGALLGLKVQQYFVENVDGMQTIAQIAGRANLNKSRWVGIVGNLLKLGLVHTPDGQSLNQTAKKQRVDPMQLPGNSAEKAFQDAVNQNSGASPGPSEGGSDAGAKPRKSASRGKAAPLPPSFLFNKGAAGQDTPSQGGNWPGASETPEESAVSEASSGMEANTGPAQGSASSAWRMLGIPQAEFAVEQSKAEEGRAKLLHPVTGVYSFEGFQFLLNQEFARAFRFGTEFTLVLFCVDLTIDPESVSEETVVAIARSIQEITREVDHFGHFGSNAFGMVLPGVNSGQAVALCQRISGDLPNRVTDLARFGPSIHFGLASVPADAQQLPVLVSSAQKAMMSAVQSGSPLVQASQLQQ